MYKGNAHKTISTFFSQERKEWHSIFKEPGKVIIQNCRRGEEFSRKKKIEGVNHHETSNRRNINKLLQAEKRN